MADPDSLLAQRYAAERPGLTLVDIEDAALPMAWLGVEVLAQERKRVPLLDEFVLRFVQAGVSTAEELSALLGLEPALVDATIADQLALDHIERRVAPDGVWRVALNSVGQQVATDLAAVLPKEESLGLAFDLLAWHVTAFPRAWLLTRDEAKERGLRTLPSRPGSVTDLDVTPNAINRVLEVTAEDEVQVQVLRVQKLTRRARLLLPVKLLIYADEAGVEVQLGVVVDGELSVLHEIELNKLGGAERLEIKVAAPAVAPELPAELSDERISAADVEALLAEASAADASAAEGRESDPETITTARAARQLLDQMPVRSVGVFEHRDLLKDALGGVRKRLLIISPWVKRAVVNTEFLASLERALRRGVPVDIAHGYGDDDTGSDEDALRRLNNLAGRFGTLKVTRLRSTHAKILIADGLWVTTSFNWLSFRGDPAREYRMEEGVLVRIRDQVDAAYERYVNLIAQDAV